MGAVAETDDGDTEDVRQKVEWGGYGGQMERLPEGLGAESCNAMHRARCSRSGRRRRRGYVERVDIVMGEHSAQARPCSALLAK